MIWKCGETEAVEGELYPLRFPVLRSCDVLSDSQITGLEVVPLSSLAAAESVGPPLDKRRSGLTIAIRAKRMAKGIVRICRLRFAETGAQQGHALGLRFLTNPTPIEM